MTVFTGQGLREEWARIIVHSGVTSRDVLLHRATAVRLAKFYDDELIDRRPTKDLIDHHDPRLIKLIEGVLPRCC